MIDLTNQVLKELNLDYTNKSDIINNYVCYLIDQSLKGKIEVIEILRQLKDLYIELNMDGKLSDFYLLFFAKDDLSESEHQWYWEGADRSNIDEIILNTFNKWKLEYATSK